LSSPAGALTGASETIFRTASVRVGVSLVNLNFRSVDLNFRLVSLNFRLVRNVTSPN
jgi:hypothetical protein